MMAHSNTSGKASKKKAGDRKAPVAKGKTAQSLTTVAFPAVGVVSLAALVALVLFQGGYYAPTTCVIGLAALVALVVLVLLKKASWAGCWPAAGFALIGVLALASALSHGAALSMLQESASWLAVAGMALTCSFATSHE